MSLSQFQKAVALLIRLPEENRRAAFQKFIQQFEVTGQERARLSVLAQDPNVVKYGRSMANGRWEGIRARMSLSASYFEAEALENIWRLEFESTAVYLNSPHLTLAFYDFLIAGKKQAAFVTELLRFERMQLSFRFGELSQAQAPLDSSCLKHQRFAFLDLAYDIPELIVRVRQENPSDVTSYVPALRSLQLLFLADPFSGSCRYFEVTEEIREFLESARTSDLATVPGFYQDLVDIGLCKERSN